MDQAVPLHGGPNGTLPPFPRVGGGHCCTSMGPWTGRSSRPISTRLGPTLRPGDVVVLDNFSRHKVDGLGQVVKKYGVRLRYRPPYSLGFNPIELAFSKL